MNEPLPITILRSDDNIHARIGNSASVDVYELHDTSGQVLGIAAIVPAPRGSSPGMTQVRYDEVTHTFGLFHFRYDYNAAEVETFPILPEHWRNKPIVFYGYEEFWKRYE